MVYGAESVDTPANLTFVAAVRFTGAETFDPPAFRGGNACLIKSDLKARCDIPRSGLSFCLRYSSIFDIYVKNFRLPAAPLARAGETAQALTPSSAAARSLVAL